MNNLENSLRERFFAKFHKTEGCWLWTAACSNNGYGRLAFRHRQDFIYAHRAAWLLFKGKIPAGSLVCHHCDIRKCVNPDHLFLGTNKDNLQDCSRKGRMHPGELHGMSKLTEKDVRLIRQASGNQRTIAKQFGINQSCVSAIRLGQRWGHLK